MPGTKNSTSPPIPAMLASKGRPVGEHQILTKFSDLRKSFKLDREDPAYHQILIAYLALSVSSVLFIVFIPVNILLLEDIVVTVLQAVLAPLCIATIFYLRNTNNVKAASWIATISIAIFFLTVALESEAHSSTVAIAAIFPGVAFFLLGHRIGAIILIFFFPALGLSFWWNISTAVDPVNTPIIAVNTVLLLVLIAVQLFVYELGRKQVSDRNAEMLKQLEVLSLTDGLTGLRNRRASDDSLQQEVARSKRHGSKLSAAIIDIDHFKNVNDTYGHAGGDTVLKEISNEFQDILRRYDKVGRRGGEEFLVICPETERDVAVALFDRVRAYIEAHVFSNGVQLTISIGTAEYRDSDTSFSLAMRADRALYRAKQSGRNRVCTDKTIGSEREEIDAFGVASMIA